MRLTQEGVERLKQSYFKLDENGAGVAVEDVEEISEPHRFYVGALNNQFVTIYQIRYENLHLPASSGKSNI